MFINDKITLESFFLADYVRLRDRVKELEEEIDRLSPNGYGCIDNRETCHAVKVSVASVYTIKNMVERGMSIEQLKDACDMSDEDLLEWATKRYKTSSYASDYPIQILHHTYQYTLTFSETRERCTYVTDGTSGDELIDIDVMEDNMVDNFDRWCRAKYLDALMDSALSTLRDTIKRVIASYEKDKS